MIFFILKIEKKTQKVLNISLRRKFIPAPLIFEKKKMLFRFDSSSLIVTKDINSENLMYQLKKRSENCARERYWNWNCN